MPFPIQQLQAQAIAPQPKSKSNAAQFIATRRNRVETFERLREQSVYEQQTEMEMSRASSELRLARMQTEVESKLQQRGALPVGTAYDPSGKPDAAKFVGRHIDLYA